MFEKRKVLRGIMWKEQCHCPGEMNQDEWTFKLAVMNTGGGGEERERTEIWVDSPVQVSVYFSPSG